MQIAWKTSGVLDRDILLSVSGDVHQFNVSMSKEKDIKTLRNLCNSDENTPAETSPTRNLKRLLQMPVKKLPKGYL